MFSTSHLLQTTHNHYTLSQSFTNLSSNPLRLTKFQVPTRTPKRPSGLPSYCKLCLHAPGCAVAPSFLWFHRHQTTGELAPTTIDCHENFWRYMFYPKPQLTDLWQSQFLPHISTTISRNVVENQLSKTGTSHHENPN